MPTLAPVLTHEEELCWLALRMVPGMGSRRAGLVLERFSTPQAAFRASRSELEAAGLSGAVAQSIASGCSFDDAAEQQQKMHAAGAQLITLNDERYSRALREIFDPPPVLFALGKIELLNSVSIGIVGTRHPTPYGMAATERLSGDLARAGLTITSGMARGIDTASHKAALASTGATIAVLGCGVDIVYPSENRRLAAEIAEKGLIISEFPMGSVAFPQNFPIRNRIVSGLSCGILVIEGAQYSGSAITARLAGDQGREIFAVPGNITSKMSWGPNLLIKQGARLVQDWNDVVVDLPPAVQRCLIDQSRARLLDSEHLGDQGVGNSRESSAAAPASLISEPHQAVARRILKELKVDQSIHLDALIEKVDDASPSEIIAALFELEVLGHARQLPGRNFVRVW